MTLPEPLKTASISSLARHFTRFCQELDENASETALLTVAVLAERNTHGDTCLDLAALANAPILHDQDKRSLFEAPALDAWRDALVCDFIGGPEAGHPLVLYGDHLYLRRHWNEEQLIAKALKQRPERVEYEATHLKSRLDALFVPKDENDKGTPGQKLAAAIALTRRLAIITGGPGTGKTTTVTKILALLLEQEPELRILLAAPTGKAAARLSESIGQQIETLNGTVAAEILTRIPREAATLHRMLGWHRDGFEYHADNPLPCDCLLIDETSMVDQGMMANTLAALPDNCRLILLGDRNQLSSVEAGSVLGDLTGHGHPLTLSQERAAELTSLIGDDLPHTIDRNTPAIADCITELTQSYRFDDESGIGRLAYAVRDGDIDTIESLIKTPDDQIAWIEAEGEEPPKAVIDLALKYYRRIFDAQSPQEALTRFNAARILTARAEGPWGEAAIRERLESTMRKEQLIPQKTGIPYHGQPVIIRCNDPETGLFNGDTGILWPDTEDRGDTLAWFELRGKLKPFSLHQLPEWQTAWTLTVHRSQGSEYDRVLLVLPAEESRVVSRELIYTGITRTRSHCTIVTARGALIQAIDSNPQRRSGLAKHLGWPIAR